MLSPQELHDLGFDLIVSPLSGLFSATKAMRDAFATLRAKGTMRGDLDGLVDFDDFVAIVDLPGHVSLDEKYRT